MKKMLSMTLIGLSVIACGIAYAETASTAVAAQEANVGTETAVQGKEPARENHKHHNNNKSEERKTEKKVKSEKSKKNHHKK